MLTSRTLGNAAAAASLLALVGIGSYAAGAPDGTDTIHGCVDQRTGVLRVIDPLVRSCSTRIDAEETAISWSRQGTTGPKDPAVLGADDDTNLVETVVTTTTLTGTEGVLIAADCPEGYIPFNGFWTVDGEPGPGNPAVFYSLGATGETATGFQVETGRSDRFFGPDPVVEVTVRCLADV